MLYLIFASFCVWLLPGTVAVAFIDGEPYKYARRLVPRQDANKFVGGWALSATTCPEGLEVCGNHGCCPKGTVCITGSLNGAVSCCPDQNACSSTISTLPVCADSSWELYDGPSHPFCCQTGQIGVLPSSNGLVNGICANPGQSIPKTLSATRIGTEDNSAPTSSVNSGSGTGSSRTSPGSGSETTAAGSSSGSSGSNSGSGTSSQSNSGTSDSSNNGSGGKSGVSGGTIGGIVGGVVGGLALLGLVLFFGIRYGKKKGRQSAGATPTYAAPPAPPPAPDQQYMPNYAPPPSSTQSPAQGPYYQPPAPGPQEKYGYNAPSAPTNKYGSQNAQEVDGNNTSYRPYEMQ